MSDTKAAGESKALQNFMTMLGNDPDRAFYGIKHVSLANENQAIETLLVSDSLFRQVIFFNYVYTGCNNTDFPLHTTY